MGLRKKAHKVWRWSSAQTDPRMELCHPYQLGRQQNVSGVPTDTTTSIQKNTLSDRKHLLNPCLIITQWQYLCILQCPRSSDTPVSGTWEAEWVRPHSTVASWGTSLVHRMSGTGVWNKLDLALEIEVRNLYKMSFKQNLFKPQTSILNLHALHLTKVKQPSRNLTDL